MAEVPLHSLFSAIGIGLSLVFLFFVLRVLLRRRWLATAIFVLLFIGLPASNGLGHPAIWALFGVPLALLLTTGLLRFGALPLAMTFFLSGLLSAMPLTTDLAAWYSGPTVLAIAIVLAQTAYAFHTAVAGRPLFKAGFLEND